MKFLKKTSSSDHDAEKGNRSEPAGLSQGQLVKKAKEDLDQMTSPPWKDVYSSMLTHIGETCMSRDWITPEDCCAVVVRKERGYMCSNAHSACDHISVAAGLNVSICLVINSALLRDYEEQMREQKLVLSDLALKDDLHIQIWNDIQDALHCRRYQQLAYLNGKLFVWGEDFNQMCMLIRETEKCVASFINAGKTHTKTGPAEASCTSAAASSQVERPVQILLPVMVFCTILLNFFIISLATRTIVYESLRSKTYFRLGFVTYFPFLFLMTSFFSLMLIVSVINFVGPINQLFQDSKFYSCRRPLRFEGPLPHITVQCPVYKEGLSDVIMPTVHSLQRAIATYERQGGTASIFINDDGLQLIKDDERELRKEFYRRNHIGWVARPGHGHDGFVRAGRFKKASNMNFAMDLSNRVELRLRGVSRRSAGWSAEDEARLIEQSLQESIDEVKAQSGHIAWAAGAIKMGEIILLIDSDTRVPEDCFLDAAGEFGRSPQVAILQHQSGVMQVVHDFWENAITYFTRCIYFSLQWATASGDTAAFVGHNAFLRWSALQEIAKRDPVDGKLKYWSEEHVSEDFEMSLKLQTKGYISRYATYSEEGFEEGVSLTCYDELLRWSKYAYGCSELVFNPFSKWPRQGPFTDIFISFLKSDLNSFSKFTMVSYIGTYYAIAAWPLLIVNYFVIGWYLYFTSQSYAFFNEGFGVFVSVLLVFNVLGPISNAASKYRARWQGFWRALYENLKWSIPLVIFLGGLSMHLSYALIAHMFTLDISWGATVKTLEQSDFLTELPRIWRDFKYVYATCVLLALMQIYFAYFARPIDRIATITANLPLSWLLIMHAIMPLALNSSSYASEWHSEMWPIVVRGL